MPNHGGFPGRPVRRFMTATPQNLLVLLGTKARTLLTRLFTNKGSVLSMKGLIRATGASCHACQQISRHYKPFRACTHHALCTKEKSSRPNQYRCRAHANYQLLCVCTAKTLQANHGANHAVVLPPNNSSITQWPNRWS